MPLGIKSGMIGDKNEVSIAQSISLYTTAT